MVERAEVNKLLDVDSRVIAPDEIAKLCPELNLSSDVAGISDSRTADALGLRRLQAA